MSSKPHAIRLESCSTLRDVTMLAGVCPDGDIETVRARKIAGNGVSGAARTIDCTAY
jgi:hypothetical protein